jgi:hypothetical protein
LVGGALLVWQWLFATEVSSMLSPGSQGGGFEYLLQVLFRTCEAE